jgi:predicted ribosome quality control (RQC) complex YloA/Tae2 family protein
MRRTLSNWEYSVLLEECQSLTHNRLSKVYEIEPGLIRLDFGKESLMVKIGDYFYKTSTPPKGPENPSSFAMFLRKQVGGKFIDEFVQYENDRIYILKASNGMKIVLEQFSKGNMYLLDSEDVILRPYTFKLSSKKIYKVGEKYPWPEQRQNQDERFLMGKLYQDMIKDLDDEQLQSTKKALKPVCYKDEISLIPIDGLADGQTCQSFSEAIERYVKLHQQQKDMGDPALKKLEHRFDEQKKALERTDKKIDEYSKIAHHIESNLAGYDEQILSSKKKKIRLDID